jgi:murein DD-endopeptidase MepM/ murein hydrolase activator NlpD
MRFERWLYWGSWIIALGVLGFAAYLGWRVRTVQAGDVVEAIPTTILPEQEPQTVSLPAMQPAAGPQAITRRTLVHTFIPARPRDDIQEYTVQTGDSVFAIAKAFGLKPESILWANYDVLNDNPDALSLDMVLKIPPVDGVLYEWQEGDSIRGVAERFEAKVDDVLGWSGNDLDLTNPEIEPGAMVMVPGGHREFRQWLVPTIPRGAAGVSTNLYGAGTCPGGYEGAYGTGSFVWPAANHYLSGNDYWSGHLGIDIAAGYGASIYAADSGVVVFSGAAFGGYGNMIMIDHGNGYQTLYAHMSTVGAGCGASVLQGQYIGASGSTGKSTGPHLHFEVRYLGGFINPWFALPAP